MHLLPLLTIPPLQPLHYVALSSEPAAVEAAKALLEVGMQLLGCAPLLLVVWFASAAGRLTAPPCLAPLCVGRRSH